MHQLVTRFQPIENFSSDINLLLSLSFLEIFRVVAGEYFLFPTLNIAKKDRLTLINIYFIIEMNSFLN